MSSQSPTEWAPTPKIEDMYANASGSFFASINRPTAGARVEKDLPSGEAPIQLYSLQTPTGQKVGILLEELGVEYDAHVIDIGKADQFTSGFVGVNPNSKIPAIVDREGPKGKPVNVFESGSIIYYLAEKYGRFIPEDPELKVEVRNWVMWQMAGQGPMSGNYGHFMVYAPADKVETRNYAVARYGMEVQRLCSVLDQHLKDRTYMVGEEYSIADIIIFPWFYYLLKSYKHAASGISANDFLTMSQYVHANAWAARIAERPAVQRGLTVCSYDGVPKPWLVKKDEEA